MSLFAPSFPAFGAPAAPESAGAGLFIPDNRNMAPRFWVPRQAPLASQKVQLDPSARGKYGDIWLARAGAAHVRLSSLTIDPSSFQNGKAPMAVNKLGSYAAFDGSIIYRYQYRQNTVNLGDPVTLFGVAYRSASATETSTVIQLGNQGNKICRLGMTPTSDRAYIQVYQGTPNIVQYSADNSVLDDTVYHICAVQRTSTDRQIWVHDGRKLVSTTTGTASTAAATGALENMYIGTGYNSAYLNECNGGIYMTGWAPYAWSDAEVHAWLRNPYKDIIPA